MNKFTTSLLCITLFSNVSYGDRANRFFEKMIDPCTGITEFTCPVTITFSPVLSSTTTILSTIDDITPSPYKVIYKAKPDAQAYVATNGEISGSYLEQALIILRKEYPNTSDLELAKAILAF